MDPVQDATTKSTPHSFLDDAAQGPSEGPSCDAAVQQAVQAFDQFLQRHGGHEGGWHPNDHMQVALQTHPLWYKTHIPSHDIPWKRATAQYHAIQFVRLLAACRDDLPRAVAAASEAMVWLSPEEVQRHGVWWEAYQRLLDAKRRVRKPVGAHKNMGFLTTRDIIPGIQ